MLSDEHLWLQHYFDRYRESIHAPEIPERILLLRDLILKTGRNGRKVILAGNGGSAAIANHCAVDLTKQAKVRSINFNEADLITCFANDYGYEHWVEMALHFYGDPGDTAILISSSGQSPNILNAAEFARRKGLQVVTFSGFDPDNPLRQLGEIDFWVDSRAYNIVEMTHHIWLLAVCDLIVGNAEYPA